MTAAVQILLAMGLAVAVTLKVLDAHTRPGEFRDIDELTRQTEARAAMRRATRTGGPHEAG